MLVGLHEVLMPGALSRRPSSLVSDFYASPRSWNCYETASPSLCFFLSPSPHPFSLHIHSMNILWQVLESSDEQGIQDQGPQRLTVGLRAQGGEDGAPSPAKVWRK